MSKKSLTQVELERKVRELDRELEQIKRKFKRALKQLSKYEEVDFGNQMEQEIEQAEIFEKKESAKKEAEKKEADSFFEVTLLDGTRRKIKKRVKE